MILGNPWGPSCCGPSFGYGCYPNFGCSMYDCCCGYSGGFCSPGWGGGYGYNPYGSIVGGYRGSVLGSVVGGVLGLGLGAIGGGPWGAIIGGTLGSSFGGSLGYLGGSIAGGMSPFCW